MNKVSNLDFKHKLEERTQKFLENVIDLCKKVPQDSVNKPLINQLVRAAGSVPANYIEANEALSKKDFVYRIRVCRKESKESKLWLRALLRANATLKDEIAPLSQEAFEFVLIFSKTIESSTK